MLFELTRDDDNTSYSAEQERTIVLAQVRGTLRLRSNVNVAALANWLDQDGLPCPSDLVTMILDIYQSVAMVLEIIRVVAQEATVSLYLRSGSTASRLGATQQLPTKTHCSNVLLN